MKDVVALHGFTGTGAAWDEVAAHLGDEWRLEAPDLPGHGSAAERFDGAVLPSTFEATVERLATWLRARRAGGTNASIVLAGYSLGARLALGLLVAHPGLARAAVLIGVRPGLDDPAERDRRAAADDTLAVSLETDGVEAFVERWQRLPLFASQRRLPAARRAAQRASRRAQSAAGLAWALRALSLGRMPAYTEHLPAVSIPVRLLVGALDAPFHEPMRAMAAALPRAELQQVADAGHNLILETPGAVAAAIQEIH
ncbi:MAG: alpha/beta fold hydrolase [Acidobacteriota bacterium]